MAKNLLLSSVAACAVVGALLLCSGCHHLDNKRLPPANVNIIFWTQADWDVYGVSGAMTSKRFIRDLKEPSNYPWTALTYTGFGGILLVSDISGVPVAYDLACPVECKATIRVAINDNLVAECPNCHSTYNVFSLYGHPESGEAAEKGYGLQIYSVGPGRGGEYMVVSR